MSNQIEVIAVERGHDGRSVREQGETFFVSEERLKDGSTWFVPTSKAPAPKKADPLARPPGAGPAKGSRVRENEPGQPVNAADIA